MAAEGTLKMVSPVKAGTVVKTIKAGNLKTTQSRIGDGEFRDAFPLAGGDIAYEEDKYIFQGAHSIVRYLGVVGGTYPTNPVEALIVDEILDLARNLRSLALRNKHEEGFKALEAILGDKGFAVGSKATIADFELATVVGWVGTRDKEVEGKLASYPKLKASIAAGKA